MTTFVKLDGNYINPQYIKCLSEKNNYYGKTVTFLSLETVDESEAIIRLNMTLADVIKKIQKAEKVKVIV
ncbi:hypothetical protein [Streptococcus thoraltensis]|uniref:hypothetical protein n=1 Tax=Streptococcus thoraltensis TaxID=55085 RepID=UPI001F5AE2D2|nr:hypothetical protein [Streptococcus thoraltensis]